MSIEDPIPTTTKRPGETERFTFTFTDSLGTGETVDSAVVTTRPQTGLTIGTPSVSSPSVQVTLAGGNDGEVYVVKCQGTTSTGQILDNDIEVTICKAAKVSSS